MKAGSLAVLAAALGFTLASAPVFAHHSFAAEYDSNKKIAITGTVTKIEWMNPHARFYLDAKDDSDTVVHWELEMGSPNGLLRRGWTRNSLKIGDTVTVNGYLAKDGSHLANARVVTLTDGRKVFAGSSYEGDQNQ